MLEKLNASIKLSRKETNLESGEAEQKVAAADSPFKMKLSLFLVSPRESRQSPTDDLNFEGKRDEKLLNAKMQSRT